VYRYWTFFLLSNTKKDDETLFLYIKNIEVSKIFFLFLRECITFDSKDYYDVTKTLSCEPQNHEKMGW